LEWRVVGRAPRPTGGGGFRPPARTGGAAIVGARHWSNDCGSWWLQERGTQTEQELLDPGAGWAA